MNHNKIICKEKGEKQFVAISAVHNFNDMKTEIEKLSKFMTFHFKFQ